MQVGDHSIDGLIIGTKTNAVVDVHQEYDGPAVVETWVKFAWREAYFAHALVHVFVPYTASLLLAIHIAYQLESMRFSRHPVALVTLWQLHVERHFSRCLWVRHDKIELVALPS